MKKRNRKFLRYLKIQNRRVCKLQMPSSVRYWQMLQLCCDFRISEIIKIYVGAGQWARRPI